MTVAAQIVSLSLGILALVGLAVRFVLVPYLRTILADVAEVKKQVSENHHSNPEPTLPDRLSDVRSDVAEVKELARSILQANAAHLDWSQEWTSRVGRLVDEHQDRLDDHARSLDEHHARIAALEVVIAAPTPPAA